MTQAATACIAAIGTGLNIAYVWPQVRRARQRGAAGVSATMVILGLESRLAWAWYAARIGDPLLLLGQVPPALAFGLLSVQLALDAGNSSPASAVCGRSRLPAIVLAATAAVALLGTNTALLGGVAVALSAAVAPPQLYLLLRRRRAAGVAPAMHVTAAVASASWICYGVLTSNLVVCLPHLLTCPISLAVAVVSHGRPDG